VQRERPLERGERELVRAERALERVTAQALDQLGTTDDDAGLRAAQQLVAGEADEIGARGEARCRCRLVADVRERARAQLAWRSGPAPASAPTR
jgi:hypothetical protein